MSTKPAEKKYAGWTITEIRATEGDAPRAVVMALLDDMEAAGMPEVLQRLRRMETKIHKIGMSAGVESTDGTMTTSEENGMRYVNVPGYDVTLAQIRRASERAEWPHGVKLYLLHDAWLLGILSLTGRA